MFARNWRARLPLLIWLLVAQLNTGDGQSQNAIGAHRSFQRTSFSCSGRPSGYYADVETGCQVYHMCDTLGRQFSYSCPNTTLFQQRMLICDHWYMVNCSKAESDYAANLLIGQRDKPFVNDEENSQRTPRPDLLDRPYAPDYSGESFRNQYKSLPAAPNQIVDSNAEKNVDKVAAASQPAPGQQRWKIPPPSRSILPPSLEPHTEADTHGFSNPDSSRFIKSPVAKPTAVKAVSTTRRPVATAFAATQRGQTASADEHDDLGTSHSTRYNTSADFNSAEVSPPSKPSKRRPGNTSAAKPAAVKIPSKIYEPPFLHPIYNQDNASSTMEPLRVSIATPFAAHASKPSVATTTTRPPTRLTTLAGKPFTPSVLSTSTSAAPQFAIHTSPSQYPRTPTPAQGFKPPTPSPPVDATQTSRPPNSTSDFSSSSDLAAIKPTEPARDLLPPFPDFVQHDIATTVGPPIYYEWKVPSNGLEPPKLDPPIGVDGREYPDSDFDYNAISAVGPTPATTSGSDQKNAAAELPKKLAQGNPFLVSTPQPPTESTTVRTPASRSVKETAQAGAIATTSSQASAAPTDGSDITKLRQDLSVPEFLFPLEDIGRTGYLASDTYNSFQLKIPEQHSDNEAGPQHWFGENPKCPECHPSYVTPGTCEPCVRR